MTKERNQQPIMISKESHKKLKLYCVKAGKTMGKIIEKFISELKK